MPNNQIKTEVNKPTINSCLLNTRKPAQHSGGKEDNSNPNIVGEKMTNSNQCQNKQTNQKKKHPHILRRGPHPEVPWQQCWPYWIRGVTLAEHKMAKNTSSHPGTHSDHREFCPQHKSKPTEGYRTISHKALYIPR